jgi:Tol biopolymer transport system component
VQRRGSGLNLLVVAGLALVLTSLSAASGASAPVVRESVSSGGAQANGHSLAASISADGRYVAFYSSATNLVAGDTNGARDVFVHDNQTGATTRDSVSGSGAQANGQSFSPSISADGRYVAFYSDANDLVAGDTNNADDVFVHDRQSGATTRVSVSSAGGQTDGGSYLPALSADGRYVAFVSDATNLVPGDSNRLRDVFVHDLATGTTTRVDVATNGDEAQGGPSTAPAISADGQLVAFSSFAFNLIATDTNFESDIFVHNLQTGDTSRVSQSADGFEVDGNSFDPSLSGNGRYVAFDSDAFDLVPDDSNDAVDVFVVDRVTGLVTRASLDDAGGEPNDASTDPSLNGDGRFVAFSSESTNLVPGDTNGAVDIFIHDNLSGATTRLSVKANGVEGDGDSIRPALSADGHFAAFDSQAANLVSGDGNGFSDVFLRDATLAPPPPPATVRCRVPRVVGLRLATARVRIVHAHCRVGRIHRVHSKRVGRVLRQSPRAGTVKPRGAKVGLTVGRR